MKEVLIFTSNSGQKKRVFQNFKVLCANESYLYIRPELNGTVLDPESGLSLVSLPSPGVMLDQMQTNLTQRILDNLGDGLDLRVSGHVVCGRRRGEIKAFWSFSKFDRSRKPQEISKLQPQQLYLFRDFLRGG